MIQTEPKFVAIIRYQKPKRILLHGRRKVSPRYSSISGVMFWLSKQDFNLEYTIYDTTKEEPIRKGMKKIGETIV